MEKDKKLLSLLKERWGVFVSGEELSELLSISRTAVWKHIHHLKELGYEIVAQPHLGYRLIATPDLLIATELHYNLGTEIIGSRIHSLEITDSTQFVAHRLAREGAPEGTVILAEEQQRGRGRMGRNWYSPRGSGIWASIILRPRMSPVKAIGITLLSAVAIVKSIREITGLSAVIKWPNDILIQKKRRPLDRTTGRRKLAASIPSLRKVGGILTELSAELDIVRYVIVGIGINVNTPMERFPDRLKDSAGCLSDEVGEKISRVRLTQEIFRQLERYYLSFQGGSLVSIINEWRIHSTTLGKQVRVNLQDRILEGQAVDLDNDGTLLVRLDNGVIERVVGGDISILS